MGERMRTEEEAWGGFWAVIAEIEALLDTEDDKVA